MSILESASKLVFVLLAASLVVLTFLKIVDAKDFITLTSMAFTFYFANKGEAAAPFAGK